MRHKKCYWIPPLGGEELLSYPRLSNCSWERGRDAQPRSWEGQRGFPPMVVVQLFTSPTWLRCVWRWEAVEAGQCCAENTVQTGTTLAIPRVLFLSATDGQAECLEDYVLSVIDNNLWIKRPWKWILLAAFVECSLQSVAGCLHELLFPSFAKLTSSLH